MPADARAAKRPRQTRRVATADAARRARRFRCPDCRALRASAFCRGHLCSRTARLTPATLGPLVEPGGRERACRGGRRAWRRHHQTAFEWRHRVFATVRGLPGPHRAFRGLRCGSTIYVNDNSTSRRCGQASAAWSKEKLCIAIATDASKTPVVSVLRKYGKPSTKRIRGCAGEPPGVEGSTVVHACSAPTTASLGYTLTRGA